MHEKSATTGRAGGLSRLGGRSKRPVGIMSRSKRLWAPLEATRHCCYLRVYPDFESSEILPEHRSERYPTIVSAKCCGCRAAHQAFPFFTYL